MDIGKALKLLAECLSETGHLKTLSYKSEDGRLWMNKVEVILKAAFGKDSEEYKELESPYVKVRSFDEGDRQEDYLSDLNLYGEAIKKIIQKYELLGVEVKPAATVELPPKAFIAHGGRSGILDKLREFIEALGIKPIIVELSPTKGMTVDEKVNKYIKDADCGIVLATKGGIVDTKGKEPKQHPRLNVIDELERLRAAFPEKTILLVERGVDLPSNISGLTYEPFVGQSMDRAFTAIARELTEFGILKAVKP